MNLNQQTASTFVFETNKNQQQQLKQRKIVKRVTYFPKNQPISTHRTQSGVSVCVCVCKRELCPNIVVVPNCVLK